MNHAAHPVRLYDLRVKELSHYGTECGALVRPGRRPRVLTVQRILRQLAALGLAWACADGPAGAEGRLPDAESRACQECHGIPDWRIRDPITGRRVVLSIDTGSYRRSSHGSLPCGKCHNRGYAQIPHRGSNRRPLYLCVSCHERDQKLRHLRFDERKADLRGSVHGDTELGRLDCHSCHDPHAFRPVNEADDALSRIERSNAICLRCHGPESEQAVRFGQADTIPFHDRFPNFGNHLRKVKCVVCHAAADSTTRHDIVSRERSVGECAQCHIPASPILDAIYGPQRPGQHDSLVDDAYVIGSTRSPTLERLSVLGFLGVLAAIAVHGLARVIFGLRRRDSDDE